MEDILGLKNEQPLKGPEPKKVEVNIPSAAENKEPPKKERKQREVKPKTAKDADPILKAQVATLTGAIFFGVAKVTNTSEWQLSPEEIVNIAEPASRILERLGAADVTGKYGDYIMLVTALGMAVIPRYILISQTKKKTVEVSGNVRPFPQPVNQPAAEQPKREVKGSNRHNSEDNAGNTFSVVDDAIPAILDPS
jgi:hypothetical protein